MTYMPDFPSADYDNWKTREPEIGYDEEQSNNEIEPDWDAIREAEIEWERDNNDREDW